MQSKGKTPLLSADCKAKSDDMLISIMQLASHAHPHTLSGSLPSVHAQTNPMRRCLKTCWTAHGHSGHPLVLCAGEPVYCWAQPSLRHTQEASLPNTQEQRSCSGFHLLLVTQSVTHNVPVHCEQARDVARCKWLKGAKTFWPRRWPRVRSLHASRKN